MRFIAASLLFVFTGILVSCNFDMEKEELKNQTVNDFEENNSVDSSESITKDTIGLALFKRDLKKGFYDNNENEYIYYNELKNDYGILIIDHEYDYIEETYYILFYKNEKKLFKTSNLDILKKQLEKLPKGTILDWYDTCTFSRHMNLTDKKELAFKNMCASLNIQLIEPRWDENQNNIVCFCNKMS